MPLITRFFNPPKRSFFLLGPRGTGKSTLMKARFKEAIWIDLLNPSVYRNYFTQPERLYELVAANPQCHTFIIDEVQKIPALLSVVHSLIEKKKGYQFVLSGSSARKLKSTGANLLGGRASNCALHPFMAAELGSHFLLDKALQHGLLPLLNEEENPTEVLQAYVTLYLQEEIQQEGLVRNLENFSRFLEVMTFSHASVLNLSNVSRECGVKRKTVEGYLEIVEDLQLGFHLNVFTKHAARALSSHPKFYFFDTGIFRALRPSGPLDIPEELNGAALEGLVAQHLQAWNDYSTEKHDIHFWRTRSGVEVDFVIYGKTGLFAIEVKNATQIHSQDLNGLETFLKDYPMAKLILLYRGKERVQKKNVLCIPCDSFLRELIPDTPLITVHINLN